MLKCWQFRRVLAVLNPSECWLFPNCQHSRSPRPRVLAVLAALVLAILSCSAPSWAPTQAPAATEIPSREPEPAPIVAPKASPTPDLRARVAALRSLYVRSEPGRDKESLGALGRGAWVNLTGECRTDKKGIGWAQIKYMGRLAWVSGDYLEPAQCEEAE